MQQLHSVQTDRGDMMSRNQKLRMSPYSFPGLTHTNPLTLEMIEALVCREFAIDKQRIYISSRKRDIVTARNAVFYFGFMYLGDHKDSILKGCGSPAFVRVFNSIISPRMSMERIGLKFRKDHATVIYSIETMQDIIDTDKKMYNLMKNINETIIMDCRFDEKNNFDIRNGFIQKLRRNRNQDMDTVHRKNRRKDRKKTEVHEHDKTVSGGPAYEG